LSMKAVGLKGTCPRCGEEVELIVSKKQLKALLKGMKATSVAKAKAEYIAELSLGKDKKGDLNF
jgi:transcription initiation factor IIE alpha subunit